MGTASSGSSAFRIGTIHLRLLNIKQDSFQASDDCS
jgi:hypothetical protein